MVRGFLALVLGFLLFIPEVLAHQGNHLIIFKAGEAIPAEINIDLGEEVTFQNTGSEDIWPASDFHPTHTIYSQFDPQQPVKPGKSWKFKFERVGNFKFHDHLAPHVGGVINVKGTSTSKTATNSAKGNFSFPKFSIKLKDPVKTSFLRIYYYFNPEKLQSELVQIDSVELAKDEEKLKYWLSILGAEQFMDKLVADSENGYRIDCHQEAHQVGRTAFELFGSSVFKKINYSCHSGYIHGAMEAFIKKTGTSNLTRKIESLCKNYKTSFSKFECLHGIGHGLTAFVSYDIPKALNLCYQLSNEYARRSCFGGVFMENIMVAGGKGAIRGHETKWVSPDPHFPCNSVDQGELVQFECYQMQTSRMLEIFDYDFQRIASECLRSPLNMVSVCFRSMGRDIAGQTLRDPDKIISLCQVSPYEHYQECLTGGLNVIADFWGETMTDQPQIFCNKLLYPKNKTHCFQTLSVRLKEIFGDNSSKIEELCKKADPMFYQTCVSALFKS